MAHMNPCWNVKNFVGGCLGIIEISALTLCQANYGYRHVGKSLDGREGRPYATDGALFCSHKARSWMAKKKAGKKIAI